MSGWLVLSLHDNHLPLVYPSVPLAWRIAAQYLAPKPLLRCYEREMQHASASSSGAMVMVAVVICRYVPTKTAFFTQSEKLVSHSPTSMSNYPIYSVSVTIFGLYFWGCTPPPLTQG